MGRGKNKQVKNVTFSGDRYSAAFSSNVNTRTVIRSRRIEPRKMYKELVKFIYPQTDDGITDGSTIIALRFL